MKFYNFHMLGNVNKFYGHEYSDNLQDIIFYQVFHSQFRYDKFKTKGTGRRKNKGKVTTKQTNLINRRIYRREIKWVSRSDDWYSLQETYRSSFTTILFSFLVFLYYPRSHFLKLKIDHISGINCHRKFDYKITLQCDCFVIAEIVIEKKTSSLLALVPIYEQQLSFDEILKRRRNFKANNQ